MKKRKRKTIRKIVHILDFDDPKGLGWIKSPYKYRYNTVKGRSFIHFIKSIFKR